ncbi:hypothetical protein H0262_08620|uniref:hypothetical protein n=1 Tax=Psychrobacter sp. D2 TaxID=2759702 RepID=UPI0015E5AF01|nr:hypothetical protein [Psychrobacter sp. D2]MBA2057943.1 hypothetical protein [Psychrobacter sp. D2]
MRYICLVLLITGSAALTGCFGDNDNKNFETGNQGNPDVAADQVKANLAVERVSTVINASKDVNTDEPQDIDRIILPEANLAEPVAVTGANASL